MSNFAIRSYHLQENPCKRDCEYRTVTCKFDGSCTKYQEYQDARATKRDDYYLARNGKRTLQAVNGGKR